MPGFFSNTLAVLRREIYRVARQPMYWLLTVILPIVAFRILRGVVIQGSGTRHSDRRRGPGQQHPLPQSDADDRRDAYGLGRLRRTGNGRGRTTDASGQGHGNRSDSRFLRKEHSQQQPDPSGKLPDRHEHYGKRSAGEGFANDCHHFYRRYPAATADETRADRKTGYGATDARTVRQTCAIQPAYQLRLLPFAEFYADDASDLHDHGDDFSSSEPNSRTARPGSGTTRPEARSSRPTRAKSCRLRSLCS